MVSLKAQRRSGAWSHTSELAARLVRQSEVIVGGVQSTADDEGEAEWRREAEAPGLGNGRGAIAEAPESFLVRVCVCGAYEGDVLSADLLQHGGTDVDSFGGLHNGHVEEFRHFFAREVGDGPVYLGIPPFFLVSVPRRVHTHWFRKRGATLVNRSNQTGSLGAMTKTFAFPEAPSAPLQEWLYALAVDNDHQFEIGQ